MGGWVGERLVGWYGDWGGQGCLTDQIGLFKSFEGRKIYRMEKVMYIHSISDWIVG